MVDVLLAAGVDVDARDKRGRSALQHAVNEGRLFNFRLLLNAGAPSGDRVQAFFVVAKRGDNVMLDDLLRSGVPVNVRNPRDRQRSALAYAALEDREDTVRALVRSGADVNALYDNGRSALHENHGRRFCSDSPRLVVESVAVNRSRGP